MKITRQQLRKIIAESIGDMNDPYNPDADPGLVLKDMPPATGGSGAELRIIMDVVDEIEGSHGGLEVEEAAEELIDRLRALPGDNKPSLSLNQAVQILDAHLRKRSEFRRGQQDSHDDYPKSVSYTDSMGADQSIIVQTPDDMDDILDLLHAQNIPYSVD